MFDKLIHHYYRRQLKDKRYEFLYDTHPDELVSFDCETTSLTVSEAQIISIGAVKIRGNRILTSETFEILIKPEGMIQATNVTIHRLRPKDLSGGVKVDFAIEQFLQFVGGRPLVGYFLEYDVATVNKFLKPMLGIKLPQPKIEVSRLFYAQETKNKYYDSYVALTMAGMIKSLGIPDLPRHDALNDAINVAMMYLALKHRKV
ncbi:3'-5' exonuclease [Moraxella catarrhalis]|uniref:3'-5' exonuclease n=1 Tax=Moraxella catarrhalis TaxID=480 RepID=UPI0007E45D6B|nr:3'-5' exonuclease [Moraxella catarrhalis]OAV22106.1 3'-5' exonuclease [Moraxella catarrhalis]